MNEKHSDGRETEPVMNETTSFPDEIAHLAFISEKLDAAVREATANVNRIDKEYMDAKRYMVENRGELDPHEMFQNELALGRIDQTGAFAVSVWEKLAKLKESPYFARIDFQTKENPAIAKHYIGRFSFNYEDEVLIFDWRAPVSSMFYDCEVGPAGYEAPMGKIEGRLMCKRQFKVKNGVLEYALESSVNIGDDVLQRELSHTSDEKMKSIIATIQKEQNQIIRNEKAETMIIQGVAGSGKTSIALHRIAFLLYRFKDKLSAKNIVILSPNKVFGDYISTVLPELGEEPIGELSFADIAEIQLRGISSFEADKDPLETADAQWAQRVRFKSTLDFVRQMDQYLEELRETVFRPVDNPFKGFGITADWMQSRYCAYQRFPIKKRLEQIAEDIHDRLISNGLRGEELPKLRFVLKCLNAMLKENNSLVLYKHFYQWMGRPDMLVLSKKQPLEWADVFPFLYLLGAFEGLQESTRIKHLVIDEMQDYTPIQYAAINRLFACPKTILGDFGQFINPNHLHTLTDLQAIYSGASLVELNKSYRSTYEIITFAKTIQQVNKLEPIKRHGDLPLIISCANRQDELHKLKEKLEVFQKGNGVSLGIILKTNGAAREMHEELEKDYKLQLISPDSTRFVNGISVTSIQMSKGLEFDEVMILDASNDLYATEYDRSLLYIACTRAMHKLTLLYTGERTQLIGNSGRIYLDA